ncbi:DUF2759 domain-containing protein [Peribacillus kribbensis]|uniref:DUF2759 domain-containing protein n=1 Tax=Peribacillus kribbensis TaxID=356658 RepID=UPI00041C4DFD|nr:DUF2759 domain-containing protein [Peribacillus kribbensis]
MGLPIIFALVTILAVFGLIGTFKNKNILGIIFSAGSVAVFGWFTVMTLLHHGYPAGA